MPTAGFNHGSTGANDGATGTTLWAGTGNVFATDGVYATNASPASQYLKVTGFGFSVPLGATILGIAVNVVKKDNAGGGALFDAHARLVRAGTVEAIDRNDGSAWPSTDGTVSYGGAADLWGASWSASDINNTGFGFAIAVSGAGQARVDDVQIQVTYGAAVCPPPPCVASAPFYPPWVTE